MEDPVEFVFQAIFKIGIGHGSFQLCKESLDHLRSIKDSLVDEYNDLLGDSGPRKAELREEIDEIEAECLASRNELSLVMDHLYAIRQSVLDLMEDMDITTFVSLPGHLEVFFRLWGDYYGNDGYTVQALRFSSAMNEKMP